MEHRYWLILHSRHAFKTEAEAKRLLDFLEQAKGIAQPSYFDKNEPIGKALNAKTQPNAVALLSGAPVHKLGSVMLRSKDDRFLADIKWHSTKPLKWLLEFKGDALGEQAGWQALIAFAEEISKEFPAIAGGCAHYEDWKAKHWRDVVSAGGAAGVQKVGFDFRGPLTGVYWLTILGADAVAHFGKAKLQALPVHACMDLGAGGVMLVMRPDPLAPALAERLTQDRAVAAALGSEYFFDITNAERELKVIPGLG